MGKCTVAAEEAVSPKEDSWFYFQLLDLMNIAEKKKSGRKTLRVSHFFRYVKKKQEVWIFSSEVLWLMLPGFGCVLKLARILRQCLKPSDGVSPGFPILLRTSLPQRVRGKRGWPPPSVPCSRPFLFHFHPDQESWQFSLMHLGPFSSWSNFLLNYAKLENDWFIF